MARIKRKKPDWFRTTTTLLSPGPGNFGNYLGRSMLPRQFILKLGSL
jgi:hypothetical protein